MTKFLLAIILAFVIAGGVLWQRQEKAGHSSTQPTRSLLSNLLEKTPSLPPSPSPLPAIPTAKTISGRTHVFQTFNNCGPASLTMALSYFDIHKSQAELGRELRPYQNPQGNNDDKSVMLTEVASEARDYGLLAYYRPAGDIAMMEQFIANDMPVIARTWLKPGEDIGHYRVVRGYDQATQQLIQDDSLQGRGLVYSYDEFNEIWQAFNYQFVVLVPLEKQELAERILASQLSERIAWEKALLISERQLQEDPTSLYAEFNRSVALYNLGRYDEAVTSYEKVASRLPKRMLWYQIEPILSYYRLGQHDTVLEMTQSIFDAQNRAFSELHFLRGNIFKDRGQKIQAQTEFDLADQYNTASHWRTNVEEI